MTLVRGCPALRYERLFESWRIHPPFPEEFAPARPVRRRGQASHRSLSRPALVKGKDENAGENSALP